MPVNTAYIQVACKGSLHILRIKRGDELDPALPFEVSEGVRAPQSAVLCFQMRMLELDHQVRCSDVSLAVIVIHASSNDIIALRPLMPAVLDLIAPAKPGVVTHACGE
jgi:hypothetical protein